MKRPIEFRVWDMSGDESKWRYVTWEELQNVPVSIAFINCRETIIEQYTGIDDYEGNKIFDGDIIECEYYPGLPTTQAIEKPFYLTVKQSGDGGYSAYTVENKCPHSIRFGGSAVKKCGKFIQK